MEYIVFLPSVTSTSHYTEILHCARRLRHTPANKHPEVARVRPSEASHMAWTTTDQLAVRRMQRLGAIVVPSPIAS